MPERFTPKEAWKEAQFIKKAAEERVEKGAARSPDAAEYEFLSGRLDILRQSEPNHYENSLLLGELAKNVETVRPQIREAFLRVIMPASDRGLNEAISRADEIKTYVEQQVRLGIDPKIARAKKLGDVVASCLDAQLKAFEEQIAADPNLQNANADELQRLKRYHLGPETQTLWRARVSEALNTLLDNQARWEQMRS
ncbi:MAG: hypothetical protein ACHP78_00490 [Terriglobales bacterium]